jgi:endonuclease III related protein
MIGAILTQKTRWENVTRALAGLRSRDLCLIAVLSSADIHDIEEAVWCTGFFRLKSKRLQALAAHIMDMHGCIEAMGNVPTAMLRADLLSVNGIGEEAADSILCYGFSRTSFVIDAYAQKIHQGNGIHEPRPVAKSLFERVLAAITAYTGKPMHILWNMQKSSV